MSAPEITLRDMTLAEHETWATILDEQYAGALATLMSADEARKKATQDRLRLLPDGLDTPGHRLLVAENGAGEMVGRAWYGPDPQSTSADHAWLYDIQVELAYRGHGYGRAILTGVEELVRQAGATRLGLNVFSDNRTAVSLYETSGYQVTHQRMAKPLA